MCTSSQSLWLTNLYVLRSNLPNSFFTSESTTNKCYTSSSSSKDQNSKLPDPKITNCNTPKFSKNNLPQHIHTHLFPAEILISEGKIEKILPSPMPVTPPSGYRRIDLHGAIVTAGLVDLHVHLREPGQEDKETISTGTIAAARGGWTTLCAMPNTIPDPHTPALLDHLNELIARCAKVKVLPYSPITRGLTSNELVDFSAQVEHGAIAFSNDGKGVQNAGVMLEAMRLCSQLGKPIATHAEDESIMRGGVINHGQTAKKFGLPGIHRLAESVQVSRDVIIAESTGAHHHLCHASTAESIRIVRRAQQDGVHVTAEAAPHHLILTDADIPADNALWKMNPPLRTMSDIEAMLSGLRDGTICAIATDNAPHIPAEKHCSFRTGAFGVVTNEVSFGLLYTQLVISQKLDLPLLVNALTSGPARAYDLSAGTLAEGAAADLAAFDLLNKTTVCPEKFLGKARNTPFSGMEFYGNCVLTICDGNIVYEQK